ncbi:hypothetical protein M378DRAFT_122927, partial [Amanita muscaria Koide BX008]
YLHQTLQEVFESLPTGVVGPAVSDVIDSPPSLFHSHSSSPISCTASTSGPLNLRHATEPFRTGRDIGARWNSYLSQS